MPSAWLIGPFIIKSELIILMGSFIVGLLFFRLISPYSKSETKKRMDEVGNLFIVFVVSLWIGKILTNFTTFIHDPLPLLAYPSDSKAFYIAVGLSVIYARFKIASEYREVIDLLFAWLIVFFTASFTHGFMQMNVGTAGFAWQYLGLLVLLIILYILQQDRLSKETLVFFGIGSWSLGQWLLSIFSYTTIFQFNLSHWFYGVIFITSVVFIIFRKKVEQ
jgi:hypothetical protein